MSPKALAKCGGAQEVNTNTPDIGLGYISADLGLGACPTKVFTQNGHLP